MRRIAWVLAAVAILTITPSVQAQTTGSSVSYSIQDRGAVTFETLGSSSTLTTGYSKVQASLGSTTPSGIAIFGARANGMLVSEAGVPGLSAMLSGRTYAEVNGAINTGIAIANPNNFTVTVNFSITNSLGTTIRESGFIIEANNQMAAFLNENPFLASTAFSGTFTFEASGPVGIIALRSFVNQNGDFLMTTQTVSSLATPVGAVVLAHFADGGGWKTRVLLVNPSDSVITGSVQFFGEGSGTVAAAPLTLTVNGQVGATFTYTIPARASFSLETAGAASTTQGGSVRITPAGASTSPSAFAEFQLTTGGVTVTQASVQAQAPAAAFRMYVENSGTAGQASSIQSGVAITNTSTTTATVNLELMEMTGASTGLTAIVSVPGQGHVSKFLSEIFPAVSASFRGVLRITSGATPLAVVALRTRYNETGRFLITTAPVSNEASAATTADLIFPHIADGGGYTTQFVLFSGIAGQVSNGTVRFLSRTGQELNLTVR